MKIEDTNVANILSLDKSFKIEDNVHYAEKAFMINSVVKAAYRVVATEMTKEQLDQLIRLLSAYVNDKIELYWEDNKLYAKGE